MDGLARSDPAGSGHTRRRCGRGWRFFDAGGEPIHDPEVIARMRSFGSTSMPTDQKQFGAFMASEIKKWSAVVEATGLKNR